MADQWNTSVPAMANQVANDIPDIMENLEHARDSFERIFETWSTANGGNASAKFNSATGFYDGTYNYNFPTNGVAADSKIMIGDSNTIAWFYLNAAPPGWKVSTTGQGSVLAVSDTTGTQAGTTDSTVADHLVDSSVDFTSLGVTVGDTVYNTTSAGAATVTSVGTASLALDSDIFVSGDDYVVGQAYVEAGGRQSSDGTWTIAGLTKDAHTHAAGTLTGPSHSHGITASLDSHGSPGSAAAHASSTGAAGDDAVTGDTGAQSDSAVSSSGQWRPTASIGKLFQLDTA